VTFGSQRISPGVISSRAIEREEAVLAKGGDCDCAVLRERKVEGG